MCALRHSPSCQETQPLFSSLPGRRHNPSLVVYLAHLQKRNVTMSVLSQKYSTFQYRCIMEMRSGNWRQTTHSRNSSLFKGHCWEFLILCTCYPMPMESFLFCPLMLVLIYWLWFVLSHAHSCCPFLLPMLIRQSSFLNKLTTFIAGSCSTTYFFLFQVTISFCCF